MNKMIFVLMLTLAFTFSGNALSKSSCNQLKKIKLALSVHGANYANVETTKTPEGGPYRPKELNCTGGCKVSSKDRFFMKYLPDHPDASERGFVKYPDIKLDQEIDAIYSYARALKLLAPKCESKMSITENKNETMISYNSGFLASDFFIFNSDEKVDTWTRTLKNGKTILYKF